jgi:DNA-directed RNA polymerase specialized sigma24 family protein
MDDRSEDRIEQALREWASWLTQGGNGDGFARVNVLHPSWSPPTAGQRPGMKVGRSDRRERAVHAAVLGLSYRLQATLQIYYCRRLPLEAQAEQLGCAVSTVSARVREAKLLLRMALAMR